jgi:hypothetical protein
MTQLDPAASHEHDRPHEEGREVGKLGAAPHPDDPHDFKAKAFMGPALPLAKVGYAHDLWTNQWGMLGNDRVGDCVFAGGAHEQMIFAYSGGHLVTFTDQGVLGDYSAVTGYDPRNPATDQGTDPVQAANYRRHVGLVDAVGVRHQIGAFALLDAGNWTEMLQALRFGEAISFCFDVPESAMQQFSQGHRWSYVGDRNIIGGHYVCTAARPGVSVAEAVTWGERQQFTRKFFEKYNSLGIVYFSPEMLKGGKSPEGLDVAAINQALAQL